MSDYPSTWVARFGLPLLCGLVLLAVGTGAHAHEVRPAYLALDELAAGHWRVTWKQPVLGDRRLPLEPILPDSCTTEAEAIPEHTGGALILRWEVQCDLSTGQLHVQGLSRTLTDVMVRITRASGEVTTALLKPDAPSLDLGDPAPPVMAYLTLGMEHLLGGIDHILFVIGLVLFIKDRWMLLKTITAFTAAHSVTLALSVMGLVVVPQGPVEAVIALSILFLARELMLEESERSAVMRLRPWLMAFAFGLLHGFGFAGALNDIGLPREALALSLLLFNLGIEFGQLIVIAVILSASWMLSKIHQPRSPRLQQAFTVCMGAVAAYWTIDRVWLVL